eukprot:262991_1
MSLDSPNIQYVDKYYQCIVKGYIYKLETSQYVQHLIPDIVFGIILLFYYENEFFSKCGSDMEITSTDLKKQKKNKVELINTTAWHKVSNTAYGNIIIDTHKFQNVIYKWVLNIVSEMVNSSCVIGIHSSDGLFDTDYNAYSQFFAQKHSVYYGRRIGTKRLTMITNDDNCDYEDINGDLRTIASVETYKIELILNTKEKVLKYIDNDSDIGIAFKDISLNQPSRLAISTSTQDLSVQIFDFKMYSVK